MKCKHCYKGYQDCPYYVSDKDGCRYKKNSNFVDDLKAFDILYGTNYKENKNG